MAWLWRWRCSQWMRRRRTLMEEPPISVSTVVFSRFLLILGTVAVQGSLDAEVDQVGHVGQVDQVSKVNKE
ncbi:hypothetical protein V6N11_079205 [Hibiscus sabdariffa]|uniref:Uncharacterized protein n=1 Tax=Hibiscus sabdariffa TaxID=183260 RepID=A0ABR2RUP6_9ROSI